MPRQFMGGICRPDKRQQHHPAFYKQLLFSRFLFVNRFHQAASLSEMRDGGIV